MQDLGTLGGPDAFAQAVNERGQVFGASSAASGPGAGVLWDHGTLQAIPDTLGGTIVSPFYLNNQGQAIGTATTAGDMFNHPFIWYRGVMTDLGTFGGDNGSPSWVNDEGEVVGEADFPGDQVHHAFLWKDSKLTDLGTANGAPCSNAFAINSGRQIVGNSTNCHGMVLGATLWENGSAVDLNTLIPPGSSLHLRDAVDVNDDGEIAGIGDLANGDQHAFLLIPDGDCDSDCEGRIVASQNRVVQYPAAMKQEVESPTETINQLRNSLTQRNRFPGQRSAPRD
jgi:probable HAF family extracellular repeat protein